MHKKSVMKSARRRRLQANCRSERLFEAKPAPSPPAGGGPSVSALVVEGEAFDDCDPPAPDRLVLDWAAAPRVEAVIATACGRTRAHAPCR
jgi:hypothetical protein